MSTEKTHCAPDEVVQNNESAAAWPEPAEARANEIDAAIDRLQPVETPNFGRLLALIAQMRGPDGCPWDQKQTLGTLKKCVLDEGYELADALHRASQHVRASRNQAPHEHPHLSGLDEVEEELGDMLFATGLVAHVCDDERQTQREPTVGATIEATIEAAADTVVRKMMHRHPHVFYPPHIGRTPPDWQASKKQEGKGILSGVPRSAPPLRRAQTMGRRAARVGFDWEALTGVVDKIHEEFSELAEEVLARDATPDATHGEPNHGRIEEEFGDLLFAMVNLARWLNVDAEGALQKANDKFARRFGHVEETVVTSGREWSSYSPQELDDAWNDAKRAQTTTK